jgi:hypothetical protein
MFSYVLCMLCICFLSYECVVVVCAKNVNNDEEGQVCCLGVKTVGNDR